MFWKIPLLVIFAYFMGSIPFSVIFTKLFSKKKIDLKKEGTGNVGTENAWISGGWLCGLLTAIFDMSKGIVPIVCSVYFLGWTFDENTFVMMLLSIPAWIGHCFPVWLKFKGGMGNGILFGSRLWVGGPVVWLMGQVFMFPNIIIKDRYKKVAFNHIMALGVNLIGGLIFLGLHYINIGYFQWGLFHLLGQTPDYLALFWISLIWVGLYMFRRCIRSNFIADLKAGFPFWRSFWLRVLFEAWPKGTTYDFPDKKFMFTDDMIFTGKNGKVAK